MFSIFKLSPNYKHICQTASTDDIIPDDFLHQNQSDYDNNKKSFKEDPDTKRYHDRDHYNVSILPQKLFEDSFIRYYRDERDKYIDKAKDLFGEEVTIIVGTSSKVLDHCFIDYALYITKCPLQTLNLVKNVQFINFRWLKERVQEQ